LNISPRFNFRFDLIISLIFWNWVSGDPWGILGSNKMLINFAPLLGKGVMAEKLFDEK
jgi:hypothetical protein